MVFVHAAAHCPFTQYGKSGLLLEHCALVVQLVRGTLHAPPRHCWPDTLHCVLDVHTVAHWPLTQYGLDGVALAHCALVVQPDSTVVVTDGTIDVVPPLPLLTIVVAGAATVVVAAAAQLPLAVHTGVGAAHLLRLPLDPHATEHVPPTQ